MPDYPARAVTDAAEAMRALRRLDPELAFMEEHGPAEGGDSRVPPTSSRYLYRAHFGTAARVAARAFSTDDELKRQAAEALAAGNYAACRLDDAGRPVREEERP